MSAPDSLLRATGLRKAWGAAVALAGVDLDVRRGEVVTIIGPSGSGKSTLLRCLNGLERPDEGSVHVGDRPLVVGAPDIDELRARVGMVFQAFHLFPHLSVLDNLCLAPVEVRRETRGVAEERATKLLRQVGLEEKVDAFPAELSGGQQQRVAIARALAMAPDALLFDEPTSALDPETVGEVLAVMRQVAVQGLTLVIVTHEMKFAREVSDRVVFLDHGVVVEEGPAEQLLERPSSERLQRFLSRLRR